MLFAEGSSEMSLFKYLSDYVFLVRKYGNKKAMKVIFFFENIQNLI